MLLLPRFPAIRHWVFGHDTGAMTARPRFPVILPSETRSREFDAKLLLAGFLAERGHPVYVGSRIEIHNRIHTLPRGLYLAKDVRGSSRRIFRILGRLGHEIVAWDEESFVLIDEASYHANRIDPGNLNRINAFFALGNRNKALIESAPGYPGTPVHVTGNPRTDLLTGRCRGFFDAEVAALRERYGAFILINSNFGRVNHFLKDRVVARTADGGLANLNPADGSPAYWRFRLDVFEAFRKLLPVLAETFADRQIVLRPHPAELHETWRAAASGAANVQVIHQGSVHPWILASAVVIHNRCTTGLEAYLLDRPVIFYRPVQSAEFDDMLANRVCTPAATLDELIATIGSALDGQALAGPATDIRAQVEEHFGPLDGTLASERMGAIIAEAGEGWFDKTPTVLDKARGYIEAVGRGAVKAINAHRPGHKNSRVYGEHRFPDISEADVGKRLARLSNALGRFPGLEVRRVRGNIFRISKRDGHEHPRHTVKAGAPGFDALDTVGDPENAARRSR